MTVRRSIGCAMLGAILVAACSAQSQSSMPATVPPSTEPDDAASRHDDLLGCADDDVGPVHHVHCCNHHGRGVHDHDDAVAAVPAQRGRAARAR